ncbi:MAG: RsmE family RNA methyltransferase [bacterium]
MFPRFYTVPSNIDNSKVILIGEDIHHIKDVLRLKVNDKIVIFAGSNIEYTVKLVKITISSIIGEVVSQQEVATESNIEITLAQGLSKSKKFDLVLEKSVELGVRTVIPLLTERCIVREVSEPKLIRWRKVVKEAAQQSGRTSLPMIKGLHNLHEVINFACDFDLSLILWEDEPKSNLKNILSGVGRIKRVLAIVGPEGGFTREEVAYAQKNDLKVIRLGSRIFRTETVGMVILSILQYELGDLGS